MMRQFLANSYLFGGNAPFIEDLYEKYLSNPQSVPEEWREYFDRMQALPGSTVKDIARAPVEQSFVERAKAGFSAAPRRCAPSRARPSGCRWRRYCWSRRIAFQAPAGRRSIR